MYGNYMNPYSGYMPQMQMPNMTQYSQAMNMQTQQMPQQAQRQSNIRAVRVPTIEQVEQIQLQPNEELIAMVQNVPVIAYRYADAMGVVTTEYRRTEPFDPHKQQPTQEYAPLAVVAQLKQELDALKQQISEKQTGEVKSVPKSTNK